MRFIEHRHWGIILVVVLLLTGGAVTSAQPLPPPIDPAPIPVPFVEDDFEMGVAHLMPASPANGDNNPAPIYGVNFISNAEDMGAGRIDEGQYQNGLATGATWNRFPFYWQHIEPNPDQFTWANTDETVRQDIAHGLKTNAILLGTPAAYHTGLPPQPADFFPPTGEVLTVSRVQAATPQGLYDPIFTDGTDVPGGGKTINPNNKWARFVTMTVNRYKPGGTLAQASGWGNGVGVTHWEMWNEPDLTMFWDGTLPDYARLLKVGYIAAKHADPNAQVIFGALANSHLHPHYYNEVMAIYDADNLAWSNKHYHDILATHTYFDSWQAWYHVYRARNTFTSRGYEKPVWVDEIGVAAWNVYPGPVWDQHSGYRATASEQADYLIQGTAYALFAGADAIFPFQLYDGCGNQPQGTDFPPHNGELCRSDGTLISNPSMPCGGDAYGLFSNPTDAACFRQHQTPESPRPQFHALKVLTTHMQNVSPLFRVRPYGTDATNGPQEWLGFFRHDTKKRVAVLWSRFDIEGQVAELPASDTWALLVYPDGTTQSIAPSNGVYRIDLPPATNQNTPGNPSLRAIGGRPVIVVEGDSKLPIATAGGERVGSNINLGWEGEDNYLGSGIQDYTVRVSVNGGSPTTWLWQTTDLYKTYGNVNSVNSYRFFITARDQAGNVSQPFEVFFEGTAPLLTEHIYLPLVSQK